MNFIFFKLAFRNILKNSISSIVNILGFSLGITACLFIFLFIKYETSFDTFYPNSEKLYRVVTTTTASNSSSTSGFTWFPVAKDLKNEIPGIDDFCRITEENIAKIFIENETREIEKLRYADANFFQFFNFQLLTGNPETVIDNADKIVLTEKMATQLFGNINPVGKSLMHNHQLFTVSGIAANPPLNTHLIFDAIISIKYIEQSDLYWKDYGGGITFLSYLQLAEKVSPKQIDKGLPAFFDSKINEKWKDTGMSQAAYLQNIKDVHLSDGSINYDSSTNRNKNSIYIIVCICVLILLLAIVNYIILYTAQKITKTKNTGILKIFGAGKYSLMGQTYIEVVLISSIASILGIFLLLMVAPFLNTYLQTSIFINNNILSISLFLLVTIFLLSFLVTYFSTHQFVFTKTTDTLKNSITVSNPKKVKGNFLISFQFTIVIILLISVFIVARQNSFLLNSELGFDTENIITLQADDEFINNELSQFKQDLQQLAEIRSVSLSSQMIGNGITANGYRIGDEKETSMLNVLYTDADFLECFNIELLSGRNFKINNTLDKNAILINEQLAKKSGWDNPLNKFIHRDGKLEVIGVVQDFNFASLENAVQPMLIMSNPNWDGWGYSTVNIRFQTSNIQSLLTQINKLWKTRFPETPFEVSFLDEVLASNYKSFIAQQKIISFFSFIAILIAVIGLLGLTIFTARTRIKEIGIRKVNGATVKDILILLNKDFIKWVGLAFIIAVPISWFVMSKWLESFSYKTTMSWWIFALSGIIAFTIAVLTVSWQSFKAANSNPVQALRNE
ncbi:MAG: ABC transporter permease [Lutibacter sp.]